MNRYALLLLALIAPSFVRADAINPPQVAWPGEQVILHGLPGDRNYYEIHHLGSHVTYVDVKGRVFSTLYQLHEAQRKRKGG